jgi:hypothetical protein
MRRLEHAARRLEEAVGRLERAARRSKIDSAEQTRLAAALAEAKADYTALEATTAQVAGRLDATILRLDKVLEA